MKLKDIIGSLTAKFAAFALATVTIGSAWAEEINVIDVPELTVTTLDPADDNLDWRGQLTPVNVALHYSLSADFLAAHQEELAAIADWNVDWVLTSSEELILVNPRKSMPSGMTREEDASPLEGGFIAGKITENAEWVYVPWGDSPFTLEANTGYRVLGQISPGGMIGAMSLEARGFVENKGFGCSLYLTTAYRMAHPNVVITLQPYLYHPSDSSVRYSLGEAKRFTFGLPDAPEAVVTKNTAYNKEVNLVPVNDILGGGYRYGTVTPNVAYTFEAKDTSDEASSGAYSNWKCDYVVSMDADTDAYSIGLFGQYGWGAVAFPSPVEAKAGQKIPLLMSVTKIGWDYCNIVEMVRSFTCGAINFSEENIGKTITVSLVMWNESHPVYNSYNNAYVVEEIDYRFETVTPLFASLGGDQPTPVVYRRMTADEYGFSVDENGYPVTDGNNNLVVKSFNVGEPHFAMVADNSIAKTSDANYSTADEAVATVADSKEITVNVSTSIGSEAAPAGSTVTTTTGTAVTAGTGSTAETTVTPKTVTITSGTGSEQTGKTVVAYVVSQGSGEDKKFSVVTDVSKDETIVSTGKTVVSDFVKPAAVIANAVASENLAADKVSSMVLSLAKTEAERSEPGLDTALVTAIGAADKAFEVHPVATITTTTEEGTTATTSYAVANSELAEDASFTFTLDFGAENAGKFVSLTHYAKDGTVKKHNGKDSWTETLDANGIVTVTLTEFSYLLGTVSEEPPATYVAQIGTTKYETIAAAVAEASTGDTIQLIADADEDVSLKTWKKNAITFDLGGHTLTGQIIAPYGAKTDGIVIKNGNIVGRDSSRFYCLQFESGSGNATLENLSVTQTSKNYRSFAVYFQQVDKRVTMRNVTLDGRFYTANSGSTIAIESGVYKNSTGLSNADISNDGVVAATGGTFYYNPTTPNNLVAQGYVATEGVDSDNVQCWTVARGPSLATVTTAGGDETEYWDVAEAIGALTSGATLTIKPGVYNLPTPNTENNAWYLPANVTIQGATENGNRPKITSSPIFSGTGMTIRNIDFEATSYWKAAMVISNGDGTVDNCVLNGASGNGSHGFYYGTVTRDGTLKFIDSTIVGDVYGLHVGGDNPGNVIIQNCVISGWNSYGTGVKVVVENTEYRTGEDYNYLGFYDDATLSGCIFSSAFEIEGVESNRKIIISDSSVAGGGSVESLLIETGDDHVAIGRNIDLDEDGYITRGIFETIDDELIAPGHISIDNLDGETMENYPLTVGGPYEAIVLDENGGFVNGYTSLAAAIAAAEAGQTVELLADVDLGTTGLVIDAAKDFTLDIGAFNITGTVNGKLITNNGTVTVEGTTGCIYNQDISAQGHDAFLNTGTATVNGGWFGDSDNDKTNGNNVNRGAGFRNFGAATINGGHFTAGDNFLNGGWAYAIINGDGENTPTLTINDADVYGKNNGNIANNSGEVVVNGGVYDISGANSYYSVYSYSGNTTVKNGSFAKSGNNNSQFCVEIDQDNESNPGSIAVEGGYFTKPVPAQYCAVGYSPAANTDAETKDAYPCTVAAQYEAHLVRNGEVVAGSGGALAAVVAAAQDGDTVQLLKDVEISSTVTLNLAGNVTIEGNGYTVTPSTGFEGVSAFLLGDTSATTIGNGNYTVANTTFSGFDTTHGVLRCQGSTVNIADCTFTGNGAGEKWGVVSGTHACLAVQDCTFTGNTCAMCIDFNFNGGGTNAGAGSLAVAGNLFSNNTISGSGVIFSNGSTGTADSITGNTFSGNAINASAGAVLYISGTVEDISGNLFENNNITAKAGQKEAVIVLGSKATGTAINDNAFVGNVLATGSEKRATVYTGADCDLSGNYWGDGAAPETGTGLDIRIDDGKTPVIAVTGHATEYATSSGVNGATVTVQKYFYQDAEDANLWHVVNLIGLKEFRDSVNGGNNYKNKTIQLDNPVDLAGENWTPIGINPDKPFKGTFDGRNNTVSNLCIDNAALDRAGLFGYGSTATFRNVAIHNASITAHDSVGSLIGETYDTPITIQNCSVTGSINLNANHYVGGLGGHLYGGPNISNCSVDGGDATVSIVRAASHVASTGDGDDAGGLVGFAEPATITGCSVKNVTVEGYRQAGGLAGLIAYGTVSGDSVNDVVVRCIADEYTAQNNTKKMAFGGLIGVIRSATTKTLIEDCAISGVSLESTATGLSVARMGYITGGIYATDAFEVASSVPLTVEDVTVENCTRVAGTLLPTASSTMPVDGYLTVATIGDKCYTTLAGAIAAVPTDGTATTVTLLKDVSGETIAVNGGRNVVLDLGGHELTPSLLYVLNGALEAKNGTIKNSVCVYGLNTDNSGMSSTFTLAQDATIASHYGVILYNYPNTSNAYDATVNINGTVLGNVWVMGNITEGNSVINVTGTVNATDKSDVGIALNGNVTVNVSDGAVVTSKSASTGLGTGIEVRAGTLNVTGGTIEGQGSPAASTGNESGTTSAGAGIAVSTYEISDISVNISGGKVTGYAPLYFVNTKGTTNKKLDVAVTGGTFTSNNDGPSAIFVDKSEAERVVGFISGGYFSTTVSEEHCAVGYESKLAEAGAPEEYMVAHVAGYIVKDDDGEGYAVIPAVTEKWKTDNGLESDASVADVEAELNKPDETTKLKKWEAYVLNQEEPIKIKSIESVGNDDKLTTTLGNAKTGTGLDVSYSLVKVNSATGAEADGTASESKTFTLEKANGSLETGLYKVRVHFKPTGDTSASEVTVDSENTVGVLKTQPTGRFVVVPVPFKELGGNDAPVKVASYIRSGLANGDVLHVYNGSNYDSWTYNGTSWDKTTNVTKTDENTESTSESAKPSDAALSRGSAAILRRSGSTDTPLVFVGDYTGEAEKQTVAAGWNLVASPSIEAFAPADKFKSGKIQIPGDVLPKNYTFKNGKWGYSGVVEVDAPDGNGKIKMPGRIEVDTLPAGTGFWYFNDSQQPQQVEW